MSGTGGRTSRQPDPPRDKCDTLQFRANLNSPQPSVVQQLVKGNTLSVLLAQSPRSTVQLLHGSSVAGTLTGPQVSSLINCLLNGYQFEANVESVTGGECVVWVRPK